MATDLTGTPTSLGIGTYNTSADAPSGLGFNAAMAQIDALLATRVTKPAGIVSGEAAVWNGASWDRSSVTRLGTTSIGTGTPAAGKYVDGATGAWTTLPSGAATYRKTTAKTVNTTVAATDLLNAEITVAANAMGATGVLRFTAIGDYLQQSGGNTNAFRWQLIFGGTTLFDTGAPAFVESSSALRYDWRIDAVISNTATGAQVCNFVLTMSTNSGQAALAAQLTTGEGVYMQETFATGNLSRAQASGFNTSAVDTTASKALVLNIINPSASASVETKLYSALVEII